MEDFVGEVFVYVEFFIYLGIGEYKVIVKGE